MVFINTELFPSIISRVILADSDTLQPLFLNAANTILNIHKKGKNIGVKELAAVTLNNFHSLLMGKRTLIRATEVNAS